MVSIETTPRFAEAPTRVVVAGGGVAGLETVLALRALAGDRVWIDLLAPAREFVYRPLSVLEPFKAKTPRFDLTTIATDHGTRHFVDAVAEADCDRRRLRTRGGRDISYDALVVATGTRAREAIPGALTFGADVSGESFAVLIDELERGIVRRVAFALPGGVAWSLPLYELALKTAGHLRARNASDFELTIVTPENSPLELFGQKASEGVRERLEEAGIRLLTSTHPVAVEPGGMRVVPHGWVDADRVIALPRLEGLPPAGLPHDDAGFIPTDEYGQVNGVKAVYAAGDCTSFPVKQGGIAAAQADVVAQVIAARAGAPVTPKAFRPEIRGLLMAGDGDIYLSAQIAHGAGIDSPVEPLWWPPPKISAHYLAPYLAEHTARLQRFERHEDLALEGAPLQQPPQQR
jgi:sulfide:quinone oxidoreductase